jgi:hypothetical protein
MDPLNNPYFDIIGYEARRIGDESPELTRKYEFEPCKD